MKFKFNIKKCLSGVICASMVCGIVFSSANASTETTVTEAKPVSSLAVVGKDTQWKYYDSGTDPADGTVAKDKWGQYTGWTRISGDGKKDSNFDDSKWKSAKGSFGTASGDTKLNKSSNAYFFRSTFDVTNKDSIYGLTLNMSYKDAAIIYINGQQLTSLNVPDAGYKKYEGTGYHKDNLALGSKKSVTEIQKESVSMIDINDMLVEGVNTIAIELHKTSGESEAYFEMQSLILNPDTKVLPARAERKALSLTIGANPSELNITWYSLEAKDGKVQIAKKSDMTDNKFPVEKATTFNASAALTQGGIYTSNQATITGLKENTDYIYRVGNKDSWSETYNTSTKSNDKFSFIFAGDPQLGSSGDLESDKDGWKNTLNLIKTNSLFKDVSFIQDAGDHVEYTDNESQYDAFLNNEKDSIIYSMPFATSIGNHDNKRTAYNTHFKLPNVSQYGNGGEGNANGDYWYIYNNVLFMDLNSNNVSTAEHKAFMEEAIKANPNVEWKVVVFHHSIYSTASHAVDEDILARRSTLAPVIKDLDIDVVLMGHDHVYTRTYMMDGLTPMVKESTDAQGKLLSSVTDPEGVVYITANSASGSKYYEFFNGTMDASYVGYKNQEHVPNITKIDVTKDSFKIVTYRTTDLSVVDDFTINKTK